MAGLGIHKIGCGKAKIRKEKNVKQEPYKGSFIKLNVDGKTYGNPSYKKYYRGMI